MKKDLPIFDIIINDEDLSQGVGRISLVDEPAIGVDWIALKKQPKSTLAKRECLGCPPNGDGTRANGEPDRRCKDTSGGGDTNTPSVSAPKVEPTDRIKQIDDEVNTLEKSLNGTDADLQKWGDQLEKELGIKGDEKDKAARAFAEQENKQRLSSLLKEKKDLEDEIELDNWAKSLENEIGISADKSKQIVRPFPESQNIFEEEKTELRKQTFAKRECLGCPPNGDGTRANGEPDRRCKDTKGEGGDKAPKGGAGKTPSAKSTGLDRTGANDLVLEIEKNGSIKVDDNLRSFIESSNGMTMTSANGVISNNYELRPDAKNPDVKNIILTQKNNSRGDSFFTKVGSFNSTSGSLTLGASDFAPNHMIDFLTTENKNFKKQTLAKRECLGCPPNGDGTRANGEPDRRCKDTSDGGDTTTYVPKGPGSQNREVVKSKTNDGKDLQIEIDKRLPEDIKKTAIDRIAKAQSSIESIERNPKDANATSSAANRRVRYNDGEKIHIWSKVGGLETNSARIKSDTWVYSTEPSSRWTTKAGWSEGEIRP